VGRCAGGVAGFRSPAAGLFFWYGAVQFEYTLERAKQADFAIVVPLTFGVDLFAAFFLNFRRIDETLLSFAFIALRALGGFWLMWFIGDQHVVAVSRGVHLRCGVAAETGVTCYLSRQSPLRGPKGNPAPRAARLHKRGAIMPRIIGRRRWTAYAKMMTVVAIHWQA